MFEKLKSNCRVSIQAAEHKGLSRVVVRWSTAQHWRAVIGNNDCHAISTLTAKYYIINGIRPVISDHNIELPIDQSYILYHPYLSRFDVGCGPQTCIRFRCFKSNKKQTLVNPRPAQTASIVLSF